MAIFGVPCTKEQLGKTLSSGALTFKLDRNRLLVRGDDRHAPNSPFEVAVSGFELDVDASGECSLVAPALDAPPLTLQAFNIGASGPRILRFQKHQLITRLRVEAGSVTGLQFEAAPTLTAQDFLSNTSGRETPLKLALADPSRMVFWFDFTSPERTPNGFRFGFAEGALSLEVYGHSPSLKRRYSSATAWGCWGIQAPHGSDPRTGKLTFLTVTFRPELGQDSDLPLHLLPVRPEALATTEATPAAAIPLRLGKHRLLVNFWDAPEHILNSVSALPFADGDVCRLTSHALGNPSSARRGLELTCGDTLPLPLSIRLAGPIWPASLLLGPTVGFPLREVASEIHGIVRRTVVRFGPPPSIMADGRMLDGKPPVKETYPSVREALLQTETWPVLTGAGEVRLALPGEHFSPSESAYDTFKGEVQWPLVPSPTAKWFSTDKAFPSPTRTWVAGMQFKKRTTPSTHDSGAKLTASTSPQLTELFERRLSQRPTLDSAAVAALVARELALPLEALTIDLEVAKTLLVGALKWWVDLRKLAGAEDWLKSAAARVFEDPTGSLEQADVNVRWKALSAALKPKATEILGLVDGERLAAAWAGKVKDQRRWAEAVVDELQSAVSTVLGIPGSVFVYAAHAQLVGQIKKARGLQQAIATSFANGSKLTAALGALPADAQTRLANAVEARLREVTVLAEEGAKPVLDAAGSTVAQIDAASKKAAQLLGKSVAPVAAAVLPRQLDPKLATALSEGVALVWEVSKAIARALQGVRQAEDRVRQTLVDLGAQATQARLALRKPLDEKAIRAAISQALKSAGEIRGEVQNLLTPIPPLVVKARAWKGVPSLGPFVSEAQLGDLVSAYSQELAARLLGLVREPYADAAKLLTDQIAASDWAHSVAAGSKLDATRKALEEALTSLQGDCTKSLDLLEEEVSQATNRLRQLPAALSSQAQTAINKAKAAALQRAGELAAGARQLNVTLGQLELKGLPLVRAVGDLAQEYVVVRPGAGLTLTCGPLTLERGGRMECAPKLLESVTGVLKLGRSESLSQILATIAAAEKRTFAPQLPQAIEAPGWSGLVLFDQELTFPGNSVLHTLCPPGVTADYLALSATGEGAGSIAARIRYRNKLPLEGTAKGSEEWGIRLVAMDAEIRNSTLTSFAAEVELRVGSFAGVKVTSKEQFIRVLGSLDAETGDIRFGAELSPEVDLLETPLGVIKQISARAVTFQTRKQPSGGSSCAIAVSGKIELQKVDREEVKAQIVEFTNLCLELKRQLVPGGTWLELEYPGLKFPLDIKPLGSPFPLTLTGLEVKPLPSAGAVGDGLMRIIGEAREFPQIGLHARAEVLPLPDIALARGANLALDLVLGMDAGTGAGPNVGLYVKGFATGPVKLDLARFLTIGFDQIKFGKGHYLFRGGTISVLNTEIVKDAGAVIFTGGEGKPPGFLAWMTPGTASKNSYFDLHWLLIGNKTSLPPDLVSSMLDVKTLKEEEAKDTRDRLSQSLLKDVDQNPDAVISRLQGTPVDDWLFGAGFNAMGLLEGKVLFQNRRFYGVAMSSPLFKKCLGYELAIGVQYLKDADPQRDRFRATVVVGAVRLSAFNFSGGAIALELAVNGDFMVDLGFPWLVNGTRQWERTLGAIAGIFQGSGGAYFRIDRLRGRDSAPDVLSVGGGLMVQFGLGFATDLGVLKVWSSIGIYALVEGGVQFRQNSFSPTALELAGAVGVLGRAIAELNVWIISVRIEILIVAEARATLLWGTWAGPHYLPQLTEQGIESNGGAKLLVDFSVEVRVKAKACIGGGFFKLCMSFDVGGRIGIQYQIPL